MKRLMLCVCSLMLMSVGAAVSQNSAKEPAAAAKTAEQGMR